MLIFDPKRHVYRNQFTLEEYISVTTLISKYKKPFDVDTVSKRVAAREGVTQEEIKARWKQINEDSKVYGSNFHSAIEQYNRDGTIEEGYEDAIESYVDLGIVDRKDELLVEEKVYNHEYKLAGTADIIRVEENGGFSVFDIKTNKKFNLYNQYSEYLLAPFSHLTACEFTTYSLQLSLYAYMYQNITGRKVNQLGIFYYDRDSKKFIYYPTPYLKTDVKLMLDHYEPS